MASNDGKAAVLITVTKQPATSTLELTDKLDASLADLQKQLPADVKSNNRHLPSGTLYRQLHQQRTEILVRRGYLRGYRSRYLPDERTYNHYITCNDTVVISLCNTLLKIHGAYY
jgi:hypothetical protein